MSKSTNTSFDQSLIARFANDGRTQPLQMHLKNVAKYARIFAEAFCTENLAETAGLNHDYGKTRSKVQEYLEAQMHGQEVKRRSVKHSIYGAKLVFDSFISCLPIAEMLANCIISHHGSLRDFLSPDGETPLFSELSEKIEDEPANNNLVVSVKILLEEVKSVLDKAPDKAFAMTMLTKLLYSCLVDADRLDAYLFESGKTYEPRAPDWSTMLTQLEKTLLQYASKQNDVSAEMFALREDVSMQCAESGLRERGIYQLSVPTGGGKTLSSLRFALTHAKKHNMNRIIYVIPYLSIIEQSATDIRDAIGADYQTVLEHHSNIIADDPVYYKLHTDRWDAPIILTTQVQFLESVFSAKGSDLRKLHNMANSVIIFDEVQSLPIKCVHLFNSAVNFLHKVCKSTFLLCTATQPLLDKVPRKIILSDKPSIAASHTTPERTRPIYKLRPAGYSYPDLAEFAIEKLNNSMLIIVNTKAAARELVIELKNRGISTLHLSTNMCPTHRNTVITEMKGRLDKKTKYKFSEYKPFVCVSTQLIEAGVNISFECVIRDIAGLDSIFQAAGRCNRHGEFGEVKNVYVVNIKGENLSKLPDIKIGAEITRRLVDEETPDIDTYYEHYFHARKNNMDYLIDGGSIYDLLAENCQGFFAFQNRGHTQRIELRQAIRTAADEFYVIAPGQTEIVVPYGNSSEIFNRFTTSDNPDEKRKLLRELGKFSVSLYKFQMDALCDCGALSCCDGTYRLAGGFYDADYGVNLDGHHEFLSV